MASKNKLLGSGVTDKKVEGFKLEEESQVSSSELDASKIDVSVKAPAWRYHKDFPQGKVVTTDKELEQLDKAGWKDHPGKCTKLSAFANFYEGDD